MSNLASGGKGPGIEDVSRMSLIITLAQVTSSTLNLEITNQFNPGSIPEHFLQVLDLTLTTFPLTLAVTFIASFALQKDLKFSEAIVVIIVAGPLSNLLSLIIPNVHHANNIGQSFVDSTRESSGPLIFVLYAYKLINIWWKDFGPIMFIQSLIIGSIFGYKFSIKKTKQKGPPSFAYHIILLCTILVLSFAD